MQVYGIDAIIRIVSHFTFIYLAFWALRSLRYEQVFKAYKELQVRSAIVLLSVVVGYGASSFFLEILSLCRNIFLTLNQ